MELGPLFVLLSSSCALAAWSNWIVYPRLVGGPGGSSGGIGGSPCLGASGTSFGGSAYGTNWIIVRIVFSLCIVSALVISELVLCEILDWLDPRARYVAWSIAVPLALVMVVVVIPGIEFASLVQSIFKPNKRFNFPQRKQAKVLLFVVLYGVYLALFVNYGVPAQATSSLTLIQTSLAKVALWGITCMAVLTGICTVSAPYTTFVAKPPKVSEHDLARLKQSAESMDHMLRAKVLQLQTLKQKASAAASTGGTTGSSGSLWNKWFKSDSLSSEISSLEMETCALESMKADLDRDYSSFLNIYNNQLSSATVWGKVYTRLYYLFAVYCFYRMINIMVFRNPLLNLKSFGTPRSSSSSDALVVTLAHVAVKWYPNSDVMAWTRQIGFTLSGLLFVASISSVLTTYTTLAKAMPWLAIKKHRSSAIPLTPLVVAQVYTTYVISTCLLLRSNLPMEMSTAITAALGAPLDVHLVESWQDCILCGTSVLTLVVVWLISKYRQFQFDNFFDEEVFIEKID